MITRLLFRTGKTMLRSVRLSYRFSELQDPKKPFGEVPKPQTNIPPPTNPEPSKESLYDNTDNVDKNE
jgi:hypothetical protein